MTTLFTKTVWVNIDNDDVYAGCRIHKTGEARWEFTLFSGSCAFQYGNQTCVGVNISSLVNGKSYTDHKSYDTRYLNVTSEEAFEKFCLETVENWYGTNATEVKLV